MELLAAYRKQWLNTLLERTKGMYEDLKISTGQVLLTATFKLKSATE